MFSNLGSEGFFFTALIGNREAGVMDTIGYSPYSTTTAARASGLRF